MGWTEERVEQLKQLWTEGLSASQIARQLGGVTRNAVIGKVHRLGLAGRATPARAERPRMPVVRRLARPRPMAIVQMPIVEADPVVDENGNKTTVLTISDRMCKWPIGDPSMDNFTFCGRRSGDGPYCHEHSQVAYQPAQTKKRSGPAELARSLRRYI